MQRIIILTLAVDAEAIIVIIVRSVMYELRMKHIINSVVMGNMRYSGCNVR